MEDLAGHPAQPTGPPVEDAEVVEEQLTGQRKDSAATEAKRWRRRDGGKVIRNSNRIETRIKRGNNVP